MKSVKFLRIPSQLLIERSADSHVYVAFLRGINVGGHKPIKMAELKRAFQSLGFTQIKTVLASGNVAFASDESDPALLTRRIAAHLKQALGHDLEVVLRSLTQLKKLVASKPFKGIKVTPEIRLYVTFLTTKRAADFKAPYASPKGDFQILKITAAEVFTVLDLAHGQSTDAMSFLEKKFGKKVTTRNWNTLGKLVSA